MASQPLIKYAMRTDRVFVTVEVPGVSDPSVTLTDAGGFEFVSRGHACAYELYGSIVAEESQWVVRARDVRFDLKRGSEGPFWPRLLRTDAKHPNIRVDFDLWAEEPESPESSDDEALGGMRGFDIDTLLNEGGAGQPEQPEQPEQGGQDQTEQPEQPEPGGQDQTEQPEQPEPGGQDQTEQPEQPEQGGQDQPEQLSAR